MQCDNQLDIYIAKNRVFHDCTKHIEVNCHLVRDNTLKKWICTLFTHSLEHMTNTIKSISPIVFTNQCNKTNMTDIYATT